jgi:hypothetical protein
VKRARKTLMVVAVVSCFIALIGVLCFTTAEVPSFLMQSGGAADRSSGKTGRALILKWFRLDSLESGDLILVTSRNGDKVIREVRRLEKIESPDESERQKVPQGRRPTSRRIAQAILDMDFRPQYWVSAGDATNATGAVRIAEADIKGKVVWIKTKRN